MEKQKFNRLTVVKYSHTKNYKKYWECICDCGKTTFVSTYKLKSLSTQSCGCAKLKNGFSTNVKTHRIYQTWSDMKQRCFNPKCKNYKYYGLRGIKVCEEWMKFEPFYNWAMKNGYSDDLTIERTNVNGNYEPSNCTWITHKIQMRNTRCSVFLMYNGDNKTIAEWSEITGISQKTIAQRIKRNWIAKDVLTKPVQIQNGKERSNLNTERRYLQ